MMVVVVVTVTVTVGQGWLHARARWCIPYDARFMIPDS